MSQIASPKQKSKTLSYIAKMKGNGQSPLKTNWKDILTALIGCYITIFVLLELTKVTNTIWFMAPFGSSCILAFALWNGPLSQPRNIIGSHVLTSAVGVIMLKLFGNEPWVIALAVALAIALIMITKTTHPPAGANPVIIMLGNYSWHYIITPVLIGSLIIVIFALIINNLRSTRKYPTFWW
ncbi:HPP family protein [Viridibacillus arvi]|uniref:HPP family protein n=1 Tax=Viridibacillus arvi TaxID=263475 RepID=UPI003D0502C8